jgi:hypothetical protein
MELNKTKPLELTLSASKIKLIKSCSLKYKYNYIDKVPQAPNDGNRVGDCVHIVFECLAKPRHYPIYEDLITKRTIKSNKAVDRFVRSYIKKSKISTDYYEKIDRFIIIALENDFFCKPGKLLGAEIPFDIRSENPRFRVLGFMDQVAEYDGGWIRVKDLKTQKRLMEGDDKESNLQHQIYSLAAKEIYGYDKKVVVDFLMVNFADNADELWFRPERVSDIAIEGLKEYLAMMYSKIENFTEKDAWENVAAKQPWPKEGTGFHGPLQCGRYSTYKGQVSPKTGLEYFACPFKHEVIYYAIIDEGGKKLKTALNKNELKKKKGQKIKKFIHNGCEHFLRKKV